MNFITRLFSKKRLGILLAFIVIGLLMVGLAQPVYAAEFRDGEIVTVSAEEVIDDDLFISGQSVTINGIVTGDLFATGTEITVNGTVEGSIFMAGQTLAVNGTVDGSLYASGYSLDVGPEANTQGNLYFGGFSLTTEPGSEIGHSIYGSGYQMLLYGDVVDNVNVSTGALEVTGVVDGDVVGNVGSPEGKAPNTFMPPSITGDVAVVEPGLRVGESAMVGGEVDVEVMQSAETESAPFYSLANERTRWVIGELIALLIVGFLLLWLRPNWLHRTSNIVQEQWLPSLGVGLGVIMAAILLIPLAGGLVVLLAMAGDWISMGQLTTPILGLGFTGLFFATAVFLFLFGTVSKLIVAFWGGRVLLRHSTDTAVSLTVWDFASLALGIIIYMLLRALPFGVGFIFGLIITLLGLGAFFLRVRSFITLDIR